MFIQTETTPNPQHAQVPAGALGIGSGTADFPDRDTAGRSPLASRLFGIDGVTRVFLGSDFITVAKPDETDWAACEAAGAGRDHGSFHLGPDTDPGAGQTTRRPRPRATARS